MRDIAIYAGTFDPITLGHIDIIKRALKIFDRLVIALPNVSEKSTFFDLISRIQMIRKSAIEFEKNISVETFDGYLVDFARSKNIKFLIRGMRDEVDFHYEYEMANANQHLNSDIDTICFFASMSDANISSTKVKQMAKDGQDLSAVVPECVKKFFDRKDVLCER